MRGSDRLTIVAALAVLTAGVAAQPSADLDGILTRVGARVEEYYSRAQSIMCSEKVMVQPVRGDMAPEGFARVLEYDLRVEWTPAADGGAPEATVLRELKKINGRVPKPDAEPKCMDPRAISPEPLAFMLPRNREEYTFSLIGPARERNRPALVMGYRSRVAGRPEVTWKDDCTSVSLPGWTKGRVWLDPVSHDILRVDEGLTKRFDYQVPYERVRMGLADYWTLDRADSSIRYRSVVFHDPDETVQLPESIESVVIFRGPGVLGHRTTQTFSNYRRFITGARIVKN